jgi:hypothetical protein
MMKARSLITLCSKIKSIKNLEFLILSYILSYILISEKILIEMLNDFWN